MKAKKKKKSKSKSISLFDQLGTGLNIGEQMKFTHSLIKHLDALYSKMLAGEIKDLVSKPKYNSKTRILEGQTGEIIFEEQESYYNPGHSAVTESM